MPTRKDKFGFGAIIPAGARRAAALISLTTLAHAQSRYQKLYDKRDVLGAATWDHVIAKIREIQKTKPDGTVHCWPARSRHATPA